MQQSYATSRAIKRNTHIQSIRGTLMQIPLLKRRSTYTEAKNSRNSDEIQISESSNIDKDGTTFSPQSDIQTIKSKRFIYQNSFFEKYDLLEKIGEGCNASIYKCQKKSNQRLYAVKKMKIQQQHVLELKQNFISLKYLKNPAICAYKEIFFDNHQRFCFLVMEYFPFPNLSSVKIKSQKELKSIVQSLVSVLRYLHSHNICHRDIKPQNILYNQKEGQIKLVDFGISKKTFLRGSRRDMMTIIGTNYYFAPQIYLGGGYDQRVDLWSLGITIYKLIAGYTPFESEYHAETIANILKGELVVNGQVWQKYSSFAKDFISRLLKEKSQRMTLTQCEKHLWFQVDKEKKKKLRRMSSDYILISEDFHQQMKNHHWASPKEEGSPTYRTQEGKLSFLTRCSLSKSNQFCCQQDSSEEQENESPGFTGFNAKHYHSF